MKRNSSFHVAYCAFGLGPRASSADRSKQGVHRHRAANEMSFQRCPCSAHRERWSRAPPYRVGIGRFGLVCRRSIRSKAWNVPRPFFPSLGQISADRSTMHSRWNSCLGGGRFDRMRVGVLASNSVGAWRRLASALAWGARGHGFKSRRPDHGSRANVRDATGCHPLTSIKVPSVSTRFE